MELRNEKVSEIVESNLDNPIVIRIRKPRFEIDEGGAKELKISTESDFALMLKVAHAYAKDYLSDEQSFETFRKIGAQIGDDFQFGDKGVGADTLAGQLQNNVTENRDCKFPTFLLAAVWNDISNSNNADIIFLNSNLAHPYVRMAVGGQTVFGHFTKPRSTDNNPISRFELLSAKEISDLQRFTSEGRTTAFDIDLSGMTGMDELFLKI